MKDFAVKKIPVLKRCQVYILCTCVQELETHKSFKNKVGISLQFICFREYYY